MKARALQRFIIDKCTTSRPQNKEECYTDNPTIDTHQNKDNNQNQSEHTDNTQSADQNLTLQPVNEETPEDTDVPEEGKHIKSNIAIAIDKSANEATDLLISSGIANTEMSKLDSTKVDMASKTHKPSEDKFENLNKIIDYQLLQNDQLDPNVFFRPDLISKNKIKNNTLELIGKDEQDKL